MRSPARHLSLLLALCALLLAIGWTGPATAADTAVTMERKVTAAYLYKFVNYVEWPDAIFARPETPLVIGILGADALAEELEAAVAGRTVRGHSLQVKKLRRHDDLKVVHVMYFGEKADGAAMAEWLDMARNAPILTVADASLAGGQAGIPSGSMIQLRLVENKLRFEVDLQPAQAAGLKISALMLSSALKVQKGAVP